MESLKRLIACESERFGDLRKLPPPKLGEHTHEVLTTKLGMADEVIERLKRDGVL